MFHQQNNIENQTKFFKKLITNKKPCKRYRCACKAFLYTYKKKRMHYILDINTIALIYQITIVLNKNDESKILKNQRK